MKRVPNALCRDDTEHGVYYYLAAEVDAMMGQLEREKHEAQDCLDAAKVEIERLTAERVVRSTAFENLLDESKKLKREVEVLEDDAVRYRWLRDESVGHPFWKEFDKGMTANGMDAAIDAAIDAAMGEMK